MEEHPPHNLKPYVSHPPEDSNNLYRKILQPLPIPLPTVIKHWSIAGYMEVFKSKKDSQ